jgi:hypothetical protein
VKSNFGCWGCFSFIVVAGVILSLMSTPAGWTLIVVVSGIIAFAVYQVKAKNREKFLNGLTNQANQLSLVANGQMQDSSLAMSLNKGEVVLATLPYTLLTEYQSTGSSYSGTNAGVSFPLFGNVRGHVGGQGGQITKNPEQLMVVDSGTSIYTNQRIVFSGAKFVRDWDLNKVVALEPGPNGFNVKIAVSNQSRTSGLQAPDVYQFGPGYLAAYAFNYYQNGAASAKKWAEDLVVQIRRTVEIENEKTTK